MAFHLLHCPADPGVRGALSCTAALSNPLQLMAAAVTPPARHAARRPAGVGDAAAADDGH